MEKASKNCQEEEDRLARENEKCMQNLKLFNAETKLKLAACHSITAYLEHLSRKHPVYTSCSHRTDLTQSKVNINA